MAKWLKEYNLTSWFFFWKFTHQLIYKAVSTNAIKGSEVEGDNPSLKKEICGLKRHGL